MLEIKVETHPDYMPIQFSHGSKCTLCCIYCVLVKSQACTLRYSLYFKWNTNTSNFFFINNDALSQTINIQYQTRTLSAFNGGEAAFGENDIVRLSSRYETEHLSQRIFLQAAENPWAPNPCLSNLEETLTIKVLKYHRDV